MKKTSLLVGAMTLAMFATSAIAATETMGGPVTTTQCKVIGEGVNINLSSKVHGAYLCNEGTSSILVATCAEGGTRSATLKCAKIGVDSSTSPATDIFNHASCDAAKVAAGANATVAISYKGFSATNTGGSIGEQALGGNCDDATVKALPVFSIK